MLVFKKEIENAVFLDPFNEFKQKETPIEKRTDPLTGQTGRVIPFRFRAPQAKDLESLVERSRQMPCPFCEKNLEVMTPKFSPSIAEEGRLFRGEAVVVPNIFPYEPFSAVVRITDAHFVPMGEFTVSSLADGIMASLGYLERIRRIHPSLQFGSVNCNYMPQAGGGLVHPHFQPVASSYPTRYMKQIMIASAEYREAHGGPYWDEYIEEEEKRGERFIGRIGKVSLLAPFLPMNLLGEVMAVFQGQNTPWEDTETFVTSFAEAMVRILRCWESLHFTSFNMALYLFFQPQNGLYTLARLTPRDTLTMMDTSDVNYYEKLHGDTFSVFSPEEMCAQVRPQFD